MKKRTLRSIALVLVFCLVIPSFLPWLEPLIIPLCGMIHLPYVPRLWRFQARTMLNAKARFLYIPNIEAAQ